MAYYKGKSEDVAGGSYTKPTQTVAQQTQPSSTSVTQAMQQKEKDKLTSNYNDYIAATQKNQVNPAQIQTQYGDYKTAQTGTNTDFSKTMSENLAKNNELWAKAMEKSQAAETAYNDRMNNQISEAEAAQQRLQGATSTAMSQADLEREANTKFYDTEVKGRFISQMDKAAADFDAIKNEVKSKMGATDAYYQNTLKPQYGKLMEGGLSLRDASDPSNYVSQGVQNAYEGLVNKSANDAQKLAQQTKKGGQADYGVLAALGNQARGSSSNLPQTGAQQQVMQQANLNQASQAYQTAMQRVAGIEDQQRLYAQQARQQGLQAGMDQSWKNYDSYGNAIGLAQQGDLNNYNAQLNGTTQLANIANLAANTQYQGTNYLSGTRSDLMNNNLSAINARLNAASSGAAGVANVAGQIGNISGTQFQNAQQVANLQRANADNLLKNNMMVPEFNYNAASGFNQSDYGIKDSVYRQGLANANQTAGMQFTKENEALMMGRSDRQANEQAALAREINAANKAAQEAQAEAQASSGLWGTLGSLGGTIGGAALGSVLMPGAGTGMGAMMGASIGGGLGGGLGASIGGSGRGYVAPQSYINPYAMVSALGSGQGRVTSPSSVHSLNSFWGQSSPQIGVSPTMQSSALSPAALAQSQSQYGLGIDPSLMYSPYSRYGIGAPTFTR